jgi:acetyltransferase-like isoleucine patch superfamily enzyme
MMIMTGHLPSARFRRFVYRRLFGLKVHPTAWIYPRAQIRSPKSVAIGPGSIVGLDAILDGRGSLSIGAHVNLSSEVAIWTDEHDPNDPDFRSRRSPVRIDDYAWLSFRATVLPGVSIGRGAVIAAGSVVTRDVPPMSIVAGVPARMIGRRQSDPSYSLKGPYPFM